jgi:hypothetical protein
MLAWPRNSPLLVLLQFVDPNVLDGHEVTRYTLFHDFPDLVDLIGYSTHENLLIIAK